MDREELVPWSRLTSLTATSGEGQINVPSGAWSGAPSGDWLVIRIDPRPPATVPGGFETAGDIYDVSAHWALAGTAVHTFSKALDLTIPGAANVVPATFESGAWRTIARIPSGTSLPSGWVDGFYKSGSNVHILTKHLSSFSLLKDVRVPTKPRKFSGTNRNRHLVLKWKAATDNSGVVDAYLVYANGSVVKTLAGSKRSANMGAFKTSDSRAFQLAARDAAGNVGPKTRALVIVPAVQKLTPAAAKARLTARGLRTGAVRYSYSATVGAGLVLSSRSGVALKGAAIGLTVSRGPASRGGTTPPPPAGGGFGSGTTSGGPTYPGPSYNGGAPTPGPTSGHDRRNDRRHDRRHPADSGDRVGWNGKLGRLGRSAAAELHGGRRQLLTVAPTGSVSPSSAARSSRPAQWRCAPASRVSPATSRRETSSPILFWDQRLMHTVSQSLPPRHAGASY